MSEDRLARGVELFNEGSYWEAHEAWEEEWTPDRHGPDRGFLKGLIQVAAGCLHATRGNRRGTVNKWRSGLAYLQPYLPVHRGVELAGLSTAIAAQLALVEGSPDAWPPISLPVITTASQE
jgi:predicted metal-dependent hydrolase